MSVTVCSEIVNLDELIPRGVDNDREGINFPIDCVIP